MAWSSVRKLADAIRNDVISGLRGYHQNMSMSIEQLEQEVVDMRLFVIKEYMNQGMLPTKDLMVSLNCIPVDCKDLDKCGCNKSTCGSDPVAHFEIPQLLFDFGLNRAIHYIGSTDRSRSFLVYTKSINKINTYQKYRKRGKNKPWVYIDIAPNEHGMLDCYIFGAPLINQISITAIFKDPRQLEGFQCNCEGERTESDNNFSFLDTIIKDRLIQQKIKYYRQLAMPILPNNQQHTTG